MGTATSANSGLVVTEAMQHVVYADKHFASYHYLVRASCAISWEEREEKGKR